MTGVLVSDDGSVANEPMKALQAKVPVLDSDTWLASKVFFAKG